MQSEAVIGPAQTEWAASIVFASKKDVSFSFCVDYRKLDAVTKRDIYPVTRMEECIHSLGKAAVFSTLDAYSGYLPVEIEEKAQDETPSTSLHGLYRFV